LLFSIAIMTRFAATALLIAAVTAAAGADELSGSARAGEALALCHTADRTTGTEKEALLERGLALAEEAVVADGGDARAHFALFCNLGRQMQLRPLSPGTLFNTPRLRREIDRTLELAPRSIDALTAKGALLLELPRPLGGDLKAAERFLRQALELDSGFPYALFTLARVLAARSAPDEAVVQAKRALAGAAERPGSLEIEWAQALVSSLAH
jgi:hypothetical protein